MCLLRWDWFVEMEPDDKPLNCRVKARLEIGDLSRKLGTNIVS